MFHGTRPGWIEVISGVMFSGKSEELIRRVRRAVIARKTVQVFKSHLDARYAGLYSITSHDGLTVEAEPVYSSEEILRAIRAGTEVIAVDEAQFLDDGIVAVANTLADRGVRVILAGTDVDFRGLPFGAMPTLMCVAEVVDKFQAICVVCGGPATRNQRLVNGLVTTDRASLEASLSTIVAGDDRAGYWEKPQRRHPSRFADRRRRSRAPSSAPRSGRMDQQNEPAFNCSLEVHCRLHPRRDSDRH